MTPMAAMLTVEKTGSHDNGVCPCCGHASRRVWGYINVSEATVAVYYAHWTLDRVVEHGANFDLIMGCWGEGARAEDRLSVSLAYRIVDGAPWFMVIDARPRPFARAAIAGRALDRSEVIGTDIARTAFAMVDAIALGDDRLGELLPGLCGGAEASHQVQ